MATGKQRQLVETILQDGKVESKELEILDREFGNGSKMTRDEADLLVELFKRVERKSPGFETFFYQTIENYVVSHESVNAELAAWLRRLFLANGVCGDRQRKALHEMKGQLKEVTPEFTALFRECMKSEAS